MPRAAGDSKSKSNGQILAILRRWREKPLKINVQDEGFYADFDEISGSVTKGKEEEGMNEEIKEEENGWGLRGSVPQKRSVRKY